ncbi:protein-L-isoaspartate O-methyltransferase [Streptomyces sp. NPDC001852]|uniref:protein-L-isoaspartate O-methyltransferase family protein n=1 Tax=Streptomyces sp. NPDC001852 TaxID=3364619 RepID=UPI00368BECA4
MPARSAAYVVSVEHRPDLADEARPRPAGQGVGNAEVVRGDGALGKPAPAPYDAVIVCAAFPRVPEPLVDRLRTGDRGTGGRLPALQGTVRVLDARVVVQWQRLGQGVQAEESAGAAPGPGGPRCTDGRSLSCRRTRCC